MTPTVTFSDVRVYTLDDAGDKIEKFTFNVLVSIEYDPEGMVVRCCNSNNETLFDFVVTKTIESSRIGSKIVIFHLGFETTMFSFPNIESSNKFYNMVFSIRNGTKVSVFNERTEDASAMQYFQFYGYLSQQQNMMQDFVRTSTYQKAILSNISDFQNKIVLDVGAGSGILSFFAYQSGAKKIYAVEASSIAKYAATLVKSNNLDHIIEIISGKIEEISLPEKVDVIISEPMGYMLLNERMLETYLHAKKWLKSSSTGRMFPSRGDLHVVPFTDEALYIEQVNKVNFWYQEYFHGVNLMSLRDAAMKEYFRQPVVDTFDIRICMAKTVRHTIDFQCAQESDLHKIEIPLEFHMLQSGTVHGLAFWFDVAFIGSTSTIWLSTAPTEPLTHWYQVRCLLEQPIFINIGQILTGRVSMVANSKQSYDVTIECSIMGTSTCSSNSLDLKNPYFRYTGVQPQPPPGENHTSPSENYWAQVDLQGTRQAVNLVNGMIVDGLGHVSLDNSAANINQHTVEVASLSHANIHQGSIPATGRSKDRYSSSSLQSPAATSLQFNQLIGGAVSPNLVSQTAIPSAAVAVASSHLIDPVDYTFEQPQYHSNVVEITSSEYNGVGVVPNLLGGAGLYHQ